MIHRRPTILSLPNEVLMDMLVVGYADSSSHCCKGAMKYTIIVSQVCALFRSLARNAPTLWCAIYMDEWKDPSFPITRLFLELSMSQGLTLVMDYLDFSPRPGLMSAQFELIMPHAGRWEKLTFRTRNNHAVLKFFHRAPPHLPILKYLELQSRSAHGGGHSPPLLELPSLPSITNITLYLPYTTFPLHLCTSQNITSLCMTLPEVHNPGDTIPLTIPLLFEMIGRLASLVTLELAGCLGFYRYNHWSASIPSITLPSLKSLELPECEDPCQFELLGSIIIAPVLQTLVVVVPTTEYIISAAYHLDDTSPRATFLGFGPVTHLEIYHRGRHPHLSSDHGNPAKKNLLGHLLRTMPSVTHLLIDDGPIPLDFYIGDDLILPNVTSLTWITEDRMPLSPSDMRAYMVSDPHAVVAYFPRKGCVPLQNFHISAGHLRLPEVRLGEQAAREFTYENRLGPAAMFIT